MSNNLGRTEVAPGQDQKEDTINDSDGRLDAALTEFLDSDYTSGDVTLTTTEFQSNIRFNTTNLTVARALNLPEVKRLFVVDNTDGTATLTITQGSTTIALLTAEVGLFYTDGTTNGLVQVGGGGGVSNYLSLSDTPSSFSGEAGKIPRVDSGEGALEFVEEGTIGIPSEETGATYTTVLGDANSLVRRNNASANTVTIPPNSSVAYPIGTILNVVQTGAGKTSLVAGSGVTLSSAGAVLDLRLQFSTASLMKILVNTWILTGDLS